ncbi:MAG TPA: ribonuclease P protein component [Pseudobdellovibrionaceae bacterium]|nr:ribonuclease P protein component [Pseudobdellovibrionaceae bacterium]
MQKAVNVLPPKSVESNSPFVLKRNSEFLELKKQGRRFWPTSWLLLNYRHRPEGFIRFGVTASRKVGSAVVRNKLKRWCREFFREFAKSDRGYGVEINVIFKPIDRGFYKGLSHDEFLKALNRGIETLRKPVSPGRPDLARDVSNAPDHSSGR